MTVIERLIPSIGLRQAELPRPLMGSVYDLRQRVFSALPIMTCAAAFAFVAALIILI